MTWTATKTFTNTSVHSTHGTRKAAEKSAEAYRGGRATYTVEHTGPRLFAVIRTEVIESTPTTVREITSGQQIVCECGWTQWYYTGRNLWSLHYECASCERKISPLSETGASQ